jgi:urea ABC transporter permease protein UrtC
VRTLPSASALGAARRFGASESGLAVAAVVLFAALPLFVSGYPIYILPQYMLYGVMAMSLALLWGMGGILSIGQAGFFALGGYAMGLCFKWIDIVNPAYAAFVIAPAVGALLAAVLGYFLFRAGVRAAYFVLVTLAVSIIVEQVAVSQSQWTGGWNGMYIPRMTLTLGPGVEVSLFDDAPMYYFVLAIVAAVYIGLRQLIGAKFGKVLNGIRENEDRAISLGLDSSIYKTATFVLSGAMATFAGALYGTHAGFVSPSLGGVLFSTEVVVWVAIGGRASLLGALLAAIAVAWLSNYLSGLMPKYWQLVIGMVFVAVVIYFRGGVAGALIRYGARSNAGNARHG